MRKISHKFWHCSLASAVLWLRGRLEHPRHNDNSWEDNTTGLSNALILLTSVRLVPFTSANISADISDNAKVSAVHSNSKVIMQHNRDQPHRMFYTKTGRTDLQRFCRHSNHERKVEQLSVMPKTMHLSLKHHCIAWRRDILKSLATATFLSNKTARCHNTDNHQSFLLRWRQRRWAALFFLSKKRNRSGNTVHRFVPRQPSPKPFITSWTQMDLTTSPGQYRRDASMWPSKRICPWDFDMHHHSTNHTKRTSNYNGKPCIIHGHFARQTSCGA